MYETFLSRVLATIQYHQFTAGLLGGIISSLILHPFDLIKIRFQVSEDAPKKEGDKRPYRPLYKSFLHAVKSIYREEGLAGLYEGVTPNVVGNGMSWGLYLLIYNTIVVWNNDTDRMNNLTFQSRVIYSTIAGLVTTILINPIWVIKTRMCLQYSKSKSAVSYRNMFDAFVKIYRLEGIPGLYRGLGPGLFGIFHGTIQFSFYEQMKEIYMNLFRSTHCPTAVILVISALAKFIAAISTYPSQVIRTRLQDQHQNYSGTLDVIKRTWRRNGMSGFFQGVTTALYRVIPASCITFVVYESALRAISLD